ncbi:hypothetical protein ASF57_01130 [Methylobacterium sp. Leaf117]|nr:hypothetical protein ASF57_01130 [Methylobacterium sp. Leaf117]
MPALGDAATEVGMHLVPMSNQPLPDGARAVAHRADDGFDETLTAAGVGPGIAAAIALRDRVRQVRGDRRQSAVPTAISSAPGSGSRPLCREWQAESARSLQARNREHPGRSS